MNKIGWIIFSAAVVLLLGGLVAWTRISNPPIDVSGLENNSIIAASDQNGNIADHVTGSDSNKIMLIEYGDYQCPSCGGAYPNVKTLLDEYGENVTFVFRNFPLTSIHPNARAAAAVAEAAGLQGKFWEMHDMLYENQNSWENLDSSKRADIFTQYATSLGLDIDKFNADIAGNQTSKKVNFDLALGKEAGVSATPTFFLNGEQLDEATSGGIVQGDLKKIKQQLDDLVSKNN
ncbi:MAG: thioredoxin domain-containing protein [Candidatus Microsaccharimonas sp.]